MRYTDRYTETEEHCTVLERRDSMLSTEGESRPFAQDVPFIPPGPGEGVMVSGGRCVVLSSIASRGSLVPAGFGIKTRYWLVWCPCQLCLQA